jgi:hypothetical protein
MYKIFSPEVTNVDHIVRTERPLSLFEASDRTLWTGITGLPWAPTGQPVTLTDIGSSAWLIPESAATLITPVVAIVDPSAAIIADPNWDLNPVNKRGLLRGDGIIGASARLMRTI